MISVRLSIGNKITGSKIMTLNHKKKYFSKLIKLMFKVGYTVYRDALESSQEGRILTLVNPKQENPASVRNGFQF